MQFTVYRIIKHIFSYYSDGQNTLKIGRQLNKKWNEQEKEQLCSVYRPISLN